MFIKKITIIIIALLFLAVLFQALRSFGLLKLIKNVNSHIELSQAKSPYIPSGTVFEKYLIVTDKTEANSLETAGQLETVLKYMKKDYSEIDLNQTNIKPSGYDLVFFTFERLDYLTNLIDYTEYVNSGGKIIFVTRPVTDKSFENISQILGVREFSKGVINTRGIKMLSEVMIKTAGFKTGSDLILNSSINLKLSPDAELLMSSFDGNPLLWQKNYGKGRFIIFNGTMLNVKNNRGLLSGIIALGKEDLIYPIINVKMIHIDDFASPVPQGRNEAIYQEFSRDIPQFYREVWWPEIIKIAKKFDIKYSGFVIEAYNSETKPPFTKANSTDIKNLLLYGRELLAIGGEIGMHGYNHQSLAEQGYIKQDLGYNSWANEKDMVLSIKELMRFINSVFSRYFLNAYVPPSNILSPDGRKAVLEANPDLKIIASVYNPNKEGDAYVQELSKADDGIIEFPRFSAGYEKTDESMWTIYNSINMYGLFAHFIHPDDVLDQKRNNNKSWSKLSKEFSSMVGEVNDSFFWLRSFTLSPASMELEKYLDCKTNIEYKGNEIIIYTENFRPDIYTIMRTKKTIVKAENCLYAKVSDDAYILTLQDTVCNLQLEAR